MMHAPEAGPSYRVPLVCAVDRKEKVKRLIHQRNIWREIKAERLPCPIIYPPAKTNLAHGYLETTPDTCAVIDVRQPTILVFNNLFQREPETQIYDFCHSLKLADEMLGSDYSQMEETYERVIGQTGNPFEERFGALLSRFLSGPLHIGADAWTISRLPEESIVTVGGNLTHLHCQARQCRRFFTHPLGMLLRFFPEIYRVRHPRVAGALAEVSPIFALQVGHLTDRFLKSMLYLSSDIMRHRRLKALLEEGLAIDRRADYWQWAEKFVLQLVR
jgi:hypothetical protein